MLKKIVFLCLSLGVILCLAPVLRADFSTPAKNLSNSPGYSSLYPKVVRPPGSAVVVVVWMETDGTHDALYFARSTNAGATWTAPSAMTNMNGQIQDPIDGYDSRLQDYTFAVCLDDPYIHIVMQWRPNDTYDYEIWYLKSDDLGTTWDAAWTQLTFSDTDAHFPDVAARASYVHVVYSDSWAGNDEIIYKRLTSNGAGGVDLTRRLTYSSTTSVVPKVAVSLSGQTVCVVYEDQILGQNWQILLKHIYTAGTGTYQTYQLTFGSAWNGLPDIVASTGTEDEYFYIVYNTYWPGNREIMYKRIDNWAQAPFSTYTARLTYSDPAESQSNSIDFDGSSNYVHISYHDNWPGNYDVMYKKFSNYGGAGFTTQRVSWGTGDSSHSTIAAHGNWAYIVWSDNTGGNYDIYFKDGY